MRPILMTVFVTAVFPAYSLAAERIPRYESDILPIFQARCTDCHNSDDRESDLDLTTPQGLFKGGQSGEVIARGDADASHLYELIHEGAMPPEDSEPLTEEQVETIRRWIEAGTPFQKEVSWSELVAEVNNHDVEPIMLLRCAMCHGLRRQEAGLDLRTKASLLKGGESGPAIVLGKPEESLAVVRVAAHEMPPKDQLVKVGVRPMTPAELEKVKRWIELGAPEVDVPPDIATHEPDRLVTDEDRQFWSFQPPRRPSISSALARIDSTSGRQVRNHLDVLVLDKSRELDMGLSPEADRLTLMRRAYFDLTGLPPRPEEIEANLADDHPLAYEKLLDRLLASPRHGERWGRFWLDAAGYSDSEGSGGDRLRPYAFKYRDYVIRALNSDKPYNRFLLEQVAGDELEDYENVQPLPRHLADNLIATGFLRMAEDGTSTDTLNYVPARLEVIADQLDIFSSTVLGLTLRCARCHSHKYDPIPQRDYFRLVDIFKGALDEHDWLVPSLYINGVEIDPPGRALDYAADDDIREVEQYNQRLDREIAAQRNKLTDLAASIRKQHLDKELASLPGSLQAELRTMLGTAAGERDSSQRALAKKYEAALTLDDNELNARAEYKQLENEVKRTVEPLERKKAPKARIRALWDRGDPSPTRIYRRGVHTQTTRLVGPGVPSVLTDGTTPFEYEPPWPGAKQTGRRLALARWLTKPNTAAGGLTARVMVNRLWKHHFGNGIVRSLDNFGRRGTPPTHHELLDWLAVDFVERGWSTKSMHRVMMSSSVYRQSSAVTEQHKRSDPGNKLLTRMPLRRLDAEELRDAMLLVSGTLDSRQFGRPDAVDVHPGGMVTATGSKASWRRSVYVLQKRQSIPTVFGTFDFPELNPNCVERGTSTAPQQALYLLNSSAVRELSGHFARRVVLRDSDPSGRIEYLWLAALGRPPSSKEREVAASTLRELERVWSKIPTDDQNRSTEERALEVFCHTILNSAAFVFVD